MIRRGRAHDARKAPAGERHAYVPPARCEYGSVETDEPALGAVGEAGRAAPNPDDAGPRRDEAPDGDAQPNVDPGLEGLPEGRGVSDNRVGHRVAISDRAGHPSAEMEGDLKPHQRRVQRIFVDERDLKPKPGCLERCRASSVPGSDD